MVFPSETKSVSDEESAPLSPEQFNLARLKSQQLDESLGLSPQKDPTEDEIFEDDEGDLFLDEINESSDANHSFGTDLAPTNYFSEEELLTIGEKIRL